MTTTQNQGRQSMTTTASPAQDESNALFLQREVHDIVKNDPALIGGIVALIAESVVRGMRNRCGTQRIYVPAPPRNENRDATIRREFNGTNRIEICRKHNISRARLYQIVEAGKK